LMFSRFQTFRTGFYPVMQIIIRSSLI